MQRNPIPLAEIHEDTLFRHSKRPAWGLGLCVEQEDARWTIQFEDGKARALGVKFLHLLDVVALPMAETERVINELLAAAGVTMARRAVADEGRALVTLQQQVQLFEHRYPGGFTGNPWTNDWRSGSRRTKRHREPAVAAAQEQLGESAMNELMTAGHYAEIVTRLRTLLAATSLVTKKQLAPLDALGPMEQRKLVLALAEMLDESSDQALHGVISAYAAVGGCSWPLATAACALLSPDNHICVSPNVLRKQAQWMSPNLTLTNTPDAHTYQRLLHMVHAVKDKLATEGHEARDLFDVTDFMWSTLRPSALEMLAKLPKKVRATEETESSNEERNLTVLGYPDVSAKSLEAA